MLSTVSKVTTAGARGRLRASFLALLVMAVTAGAASGGDALKFKHKLSPGVLTAHGDWTVSLDYDLGLSTELWTQPTAASFRKNVTAHVATKGALAVDPDLNTTPLVADAGVTTSINLYRPSKVVPGEKPGDYQTVQEGFNCGRLSLGILGGYETDQRLDNRNFTGGVELGYVLTENRGVKALVPSVFVGYDFVVVDHSELQQALGDDDETRRLRVFSSWKLPVGQWLSGPFDPLNAHFDVRYYLSDGTSSTVRALDKDDALYVAGALSYSFGENPLWGFVNSAHVKVANGRIPPVTDDATTVTVGLTLWEK